MRQRKNEMFKQRLSFLSNMSACRIVVKGIEFNSTEALYQALKCKNPEERIKFSKISGYEAKKLGRTIQIREDWHSKKMQFMEKLIDAKFNKEPFKTKLMAMEGDIIEYNYWNDKFWGIDIRTQTGENKLGKLLMKKREKLRQGE